MFLRREAAVQQAGGHVDGTGAYLAYALRVMKDAAFLPLDAPATSMGGLLGGDAQRMAKVRDSAADVLGEPIASSSRLRHGRIGNQCFHGPHRGGPTAGSAGVIPGVLLALQKAKGYSDEQLQHALACAAAVGYLITRNATVSGAEGGCQAEIGSAAAMAAAACVELEGGTPEQCLNAAGNALTNMMGLVCDPGCRPGGGALPEAQRLGRGNGAGERPDLACRHRQPGGLRPNGGGHVQGGPQPSLRAARIGPGRPAATPDACAWCESHMCGK